MFLFNPKNLVATVQDRAASHPQQLAYIFLKNNIEYKLTYVELDMRARAVAAYLQALGMQGQRVLLLYPPGLEFITAFMGCLYAGAIAIPCAAPRLDAFEKAYNVLSNIINNAEVNVILTNADYFAKLEQPDAKTFLSEKIFITPTVAINNDAAAKYHKPKLKKDTVAYLQYSSGSTSTPKGAVITFENLTQSLTSTLKAWDYDRHSITLNWAPHSHVYGLICGILLPLYHGSLAILMATEDFISRPVSWLQAITRYKATHGGCPNFGYELCIRDIAENVLSELNLRSWRVAVNGGETVQAATLTQFTNKFSSCGFRAKQFNSAFGMSEVTGAIAATTVGKAPTVLKLANEALKNNRVQLSKPDELYRNIVSSGKLLSGLEAVIVDPKTLIPVTNNQIGEVWLAGRAVAKGYWNLTEETAAVFNAKLPASSASYFRTGDLGFVANRELYLTGRLKELLVVYGKKYYPLDLETSVREALTEFPIEATNAVFSVVVSENEEIIFVQEVAADIESEQAYEIKQTIRNVLTAQHGINAHDIILVQPKSIPKTPSGKLQRKLCQRQYLENKLTIIKPGQSNSQLKQTQTKTELVERFEIDFINIIAQVLNLNPEAIRLDLPVSEYAFDSLNIIKLAANLNEKFHFQLSPAQLYEYASLSKFSEDLVRTHHDILAKYYDVSVFSAQNSAKEFKRTASSLSTSRDIAIIGISGRFPQADDVDSFWQNLTTGKDCITEIPQTRWQWQDYASPVKWGGFVDGIGEFDAPFFNISPREAELIDPQQRLFLQTTWNAIENAGYNPAQLAQHKVGLFVGVYNNDYAELIQKQNITDAYITTGLTHSILANRISYLLNFTGPSVAIDAACSSSLVALHEAVKAIHNQDCEIAIVGGANALLTPTSFLSGDQAGMLSDTGSCKTFDKDADGYVRGEGIIAIVLKPLDLAVQDNDAIYGVIKGTAVNHGGHVSSLTVPNPNAQAEVIQTALQRSNIAPATISYIETHGTGTSLGDPVEINGLKKAFGEQEQKYFCGLGAVKTNIGHLEAAAGLAGIVKVLLSMRHEQIPGNLHFHTLNPYIELTDSPFYIVDKTQAWERLQDAESNIVPLRAGISSFGFGGSNAHVVLEEAPQAITPTKSEMKAYLIPLSAKTETALRQKLKDLLAWLRNQSVLPSLADLAYTLSTGREHFNLRCIFAVETLDALRESLSKSLQSDDVENFIINTEGGDDKKKKNAAIFQALYKQLLQEVESNHQLSQQQYKEKLLALGNFYTEGHDLDWRRFYQTPHHRIALPGYPFDKHYYWLQKTTTTQTEAPKVQPEEIIAATATYDAEADISDLVKNDLKTNVAELLKHDPNTISLTTSLSEQGFDSIAFNLLAVQLEEYYNVAFNPTVFFTHSSIDDLTKYFLETYPTELSKKYHSPGSTRVSSHTPPKVEQGASVTATPPQKKDPIAVIGMQAIMPQSPNLETFWHHLEAGDNLISEIPASRWNWQTYYGDPKENPEKTNIKWGGFIDDVTHFDAGFFNLSTREANLMDPQHRLFMQVAWSTIEDAGYDPLSLSNQSVGVFVGVEFNEYASMLGSQHQFHGYNATGNAHAMLPNRISYFLNLHGPSESIDTACSSALVAVNRAVHALQNHECNAALVGGVNLLLTPESFIIANQLGVLSNDGACKTFDKSANGYVRGEGIGAVLLKRLSDAEKDGDFIYGIIKGSAVNHGGKSQSLTAPNVTAQSDVIIKALKNADVSPDTVTYVEAHGTGTELGDPVEVEGLKLAFRTINPDAKAKNYCGIGAVKTNVGHLEPAAGIAGLLKVLLSLQHKKIPGNLHLKELNTHVELENSPFYLINKTQDWQTLSAEGKPIPRRAGLSSFGFGGTNAHLILEEANNAHRKPVHAQAPYYLIALSAKDESGLRQKFQDLLTWLTTHPEQANLAGISFTLNKGRSHFARRAALIVSSIQDLTDKLQQLLQGEKPQHVMIQAGPLDANNDVFKNTYDNAIESLNANNSTAYLNQLLIIADLYTKQYPITWSDIYKTQSPNRIPGLPNYPFKKIRHWYDQEVTQAARVSHSTQTNDSQATTESYLKTIFAEKLRIDANTISSTETYETYGVESLNGLEIINRLEKDLGAIPKTLLYQKNTIKALAEYLNQNFSRQLQSILNKPITEAKVQAPKSLQPASTTEFEIAIIGITGTFPGAKDMQALWENLKAGKDSITEIPKERWDYHDYPVQTDNETQYFKHGGFIEDVDKFDPLFFNMPPRDAALIDPQERLFLESAWLTIEDAGYTRDTIQNKFNNEVGVFAGVTHNFYPLYMAEEWAKGNRIPINTQIFSIANRVSYFMNWQGPSFALDTACSSSLTAIHLACESLRLGECQMALAGGVNLSLHPSKYHMLGTYNFLSHDGRCASFAEGGAGYVPAEGVATVLLKPLRAAIRDNDRIYAVIKASSMNHGGKTSGYTVPNPNAQAALIKKALRTANIDPRSINYIEAHGTGTTLGDPIEITGLQIAFEDSTSDKQFCAIGSIKSNIGHLESAAGIAQLAKVILQLQHKELVPSIHAESLNRFIDFKNSPFYVQRELKPWQPVPGFPRRAGISSFGAGGSNVHLIVEEYEAETLAKSEGVQPPYLFLLSAFNTERLQDYAQITLDYLTSLKESEALLSQICYTSQIGRESMTARLAIMASTLSELNSRLGEFIRNPEVAISNVWFNPSAHKQDKTSTTVDLKQLAQLWIDGFRIDWEKLYQGKAIQRTFLPTYPFAKRRCWIQTEVAQTEVLSTPNTDIDEWLYDIAWETKALGKAAPAIEGERWLIFSDDELGFTLQDTLGDAIYCFQGEEFKQLADNVFYLNPDKPDECDKLLQALKQVNIKGIIYLWSMLATNPVDGAKTLLFVFKSLIKHNWSHKLLYCLVTRSGQAVVTEDHVVANQHHLWSMTRTFGQEQGQFNILLLDLDSNKQLQQEAQLIHSEIMCYQPEENQIGLRQKQRYVMRLIHSSNEPIKNRRLGEARSSTATSTTAALITGGLGALGFEIAKHLTSTGTKYLLLTGTTQLPERTQWQTEQPANLKEKITQLQTLEATGSKVIYRAIDVTDKAAMQTAIQAAEKEWQISIDGVFHLAGITTDSILIADLTLETFDKVFAAKVKGAIVLNELFQKPNLKQFVLFSSTAALPFFGLRGLSAYSAANAFLDGLALQRRAQDLPGFGINWAAWAEKGMGQRHDHTKFLEAVGITPITIDQGLKIFAQLMQLHVPRMIVLKIQWDKFLQMNPEAKRLGFFAEIVTANLPKIQGQSLILDNNGDAKTQVLAILADILAVNPNEIDATQPLLTYGVDSIVGLKFIVKLVAHFGEVVSPMDLYRYPTVTQLANYIQMQMQPDISAVAKNDEELSHLSTDEITRLIEDELKDLNDYD